MTVIYKTSNRYASPVKLFWYVLPTAPGCYINLSHNAFSLGRENAGLINCAQRSDGDFGWCRLNQVHTLHFSLTTSAPAYLGEVTERRGSFNYSDLIDRR